jgi:hypothetical protein
VLSWDLEDRLEIVALKLSRGPKRRVVPASTIPESSARVPFMITQAQKEALRAKGFEDDEIAAMTPAMAHGLLGIK